MTRATFRYAGSKTLSLKHIYKFIPPVSAASKFITNFAEPFCGTAIVTLNKPRHPLETINDINGDVVNFFRVLREDVDALIGLIALTPYARDELAACTYDSALPPLERARRFYARQMMAFNTSRENPSFLRRKYARRIEDNNSSSPAATFANHNYLRAYAARLATVQIENLDVVKFINDFGGDRTLFYVDAPYLVDNDSENGRKNASMYTYEMPDDAIHDAYLEALISSGSYAIVSHYRHDLYDDVLDGWKRYDFTARTAGATKTESLYISPGLTELNNEIERRGEFAVQRSIFGGIG